MQEGLAEKQKTRTEQNYHSVTTLQLVPVIKLRRSDK